MKKIREYILKGKEISIGLEDSKKTWKLCARALLRKYVLYPELDLEFLQKYFS